MRVWGNLKNFTENHSILKLNTHLKESSRAINNNAEAIENIDGIELGETSTTAYRGDRGKTAYDHSQSPHAPSDANNYTHPATHAPSIIAQDSSNRFVTDTEKASWDAKLDSVTKSDVGLGNVDNTSDANKPVSTAQQTALDAKFDKAGGSINGDVIFPVGNEDRFFRFDYSSAGYGWRFGYLGTGSGDANYFAIQSEKTSDNVFYDALKIGLLTLNAYFYGDIYEKGTALADKYAPIAHTSDQNNPHSVTKSDVGLGSVTNEAQIPKSIVDSKGDIIVGLANDTLGKLPTGNEFQLLMCTSAAPNGLSWVDLVENKLTLSDNTTNDVSTTKHGFCPKLPGDTDKFLRGDGTYDTPVSDSGWQTPTLLNSWANFGSGYQTARYKKVNNVVYIEGMVKSGTPPSVAFTLPTGYRPAARLIFNTYCSSGAARVDVDADGDVVIHTASSTWTSINLSFAI